MPHLILEAWITQDKLMRIICVLFVTLIITEAACSQGKNTQVLRMWTKASWLYEITLYQSSQDSIFGVENWSGKKIGFAKRTISKIIDPEGNDLSDRYLSEQQKAYYPVEFTIAEMSPREMSDWNSISTVNQHSTEMDATTVESRASIGLSVGSGLGVDASFKNIIISFWTDTFGKDIPDGTEIDVPFSWFSQTEPLDVSKAFGLGIQTQLSGNLYVGVMPEYVSTIHYKKYRSQVTGWDWYTKSQEGTVGFTLSVSLRQSPILLNGFWGTSRGLMGGLGIIIN